jgi:sugar lactone lactonase YvrE
MIFKRIGFPIVCASTVLTACSAGGPSSAPLPGTPATLQAKQAMQVTHLAQSVRADVRFGLNRATLDEALMSRGAGTFPESAKKQPILFVSDLDAQTIRLYPANTTNPSQEGSITQGIDEPINVAVDKRGTIYVANNGNNTVTEYPLGETKPSVTLSTSLVYPNGVAVDSKGTVYVTSGQNVGSCYVLEFPKGSTKPNVQVNGFGLPIGLAVDKNDNLYVADATGDVVWKVAKGSNSATKLDLPGLADPTGVAINPADDLYVSNEDPGQEGGDKIFGFVLGKSQPFVTITADLDGPYTLGFENDGTLFVGNGSMNPGYITAYKKMKIMPFEKFTNGLGNPVGVAVYPAAP